MRQDNRLLFSRFKDKNIEEIFKGLKTPFYVIDTFKLKYNGNILKYVQDETGCKILLAQKAFSNFNLYPLLENYLAGTEASGLYEARLGKEEMPNKEVHVFSGAYKEDDIDEILSYSDHIVFNSINQLKKFGPKAKALNKSVGLRVNPEISTQKGHEMYDPCTKGSRLGVPFENFKQMDSDTLSLLDGLHFHTLCQQNSPDLEKTLEVFEEKFKDYLPKLKWLNFGGGHHITKEDYDIDLLIKLIKYFMNTYNVMVYLEPGEACVLNAGYLVTRLLDSFNYDGKNIGILDTSAACHNPDVLECHFLPPMLGANLEGNNILYRFGGPTCLSGDVIGEYLFDDYLKENQMLIFGDTALYTSVKTNTFNGMPLPNIYVMDDDYNLECLTNFGYMDFKYRLGKIK